MSLRKIAVILAAGGLAVGLVGGGVGAQFTDQVQAIQGIQVGTFSCVISDGGGGVISADKHSVTYSTFNITSSAAASDPINFTVQNTGSIGDVLTVSTTPVSAPFSIIGMPFAAVPLAPSATHTYNTGVQWTELNNSNLGQTGSVTWTVNCGEQAAAGATVIFDNTAAVLPSNLPSYGPEAYSYNEWGGGVTFAGTARNLSTATVTMSSWACQTGSWTVPFGTPGACVTTPGATYNVPITFNIYAVTGTNSVGALLATKTQTFVIPYRPSSIAGGDGETWNGSSHGIADNITFTFPAGTTLPDTAIFGVTFNTDHSGYVPINGSSAPTDSLNIATYPATDTATQAVVGTWLPNDTSSYLSPRGASTMIGDAAVTNMPTGSGDNFVSYMPAVQITAN